MTTKRKYFGVILGSLYLIMVLRGVSYGKVIRVPLEFDTIQAGIDAAESGDVVKVDAGAYIERITMKEGIKLVGSGVEYTSIYYFDSECASIIIMDSNCVLRGFTINSEIVVSPNPVSKDGTITIKATGKNNTGHSSKGLFSG